MHDYFRTQAIGTNKRNRTRGLLIDTAIDVFSQKGFEAASVQEIAACAGLANGTFYNHFKDKEELAFAVAESVALELAKQLDGQMAGLERGASRIVVASGAFLRLALTYESWASVLLEQFQRRRAVNAAPFRYLVADIQKAVEQGQLDIEADSFVVEHIVAVMIASLRMLLDSGLQVSVIHRTCESILRLLGMPPAQAKREVARVADHPLLQSGEGALALS